MARNVKLGFLLSAKDAGATKAVTTLASVFRNSWGGMMGTLTGLNQGLNLARKAWRAVDFAIGDTVRSALKFRLDGVGAQFQAFGRSAELVRARLGDAMIPVLQAFMQALKPIIDRTKTWLEENNKLAASKFGDAMIGVARILANVVIPAIGLVGAAYLGLKVTVQGVLAGVFAIAATFLSKWQSILNTVGNAADALGLTGIAEKARGAASAIGQFAQGAGAMYAEHADGVKATLEQYGVFSSTVGGLQLGINRAADSAETLLSKLNTGGVGGVQTLKEHNDALKEQEQHLRDLEAQERKLAAARALGNQKVRERDAALLVEQKRQVALANEMGAAFGAAFGAYTAGSLTAAQAVKTFGAAALGQVRTIVMAYAVEAALAAMKSQAGIPIVGPLLGVAAAAAIFAVAEAYMAKMHSGGVVRGGPGQEVPIIARAGEEVLREDDPRHRRNRGMAAAGGDGDTFVFQSLIPHTQAQLDLYLRRHVKPAWRANRKNGFG